MELTNWGNYPKIEATSHSPIGDVALQELMAASDGLIARGLGRCYGDSSLHRNVVNSGAWKRLLGFDDVQGILTCEAGVSFEDILQVFVPRGWFPPVTPGTKYITVGGAIAADVHGKNHHIDGSFSKHLKSLRLLTGDGRIIECSPNQEADLFNATCGGMGLTGIILSASFQLKKIRTSFIKRRTCRFNNLDAVMDAFTKNTTATYSVAWIDGLASGKSLGRSVLYLGEHAQPDDLSRKQQISPCEWVNKRKLTVPFYFPSFSLNPITIKAFNGVLYHGSPKQWREDIIDYDRFFYPLDNILHWNRCYGKRGFTQYQFVLPLDSSRAGLIAILKRIAKSGAGSFLSVLKLFGKQDGVLSFPREGYTLALDFPIKPSNFKLLDELDRIVLDHDGRLYLAKDSRMKATTFKSSYKNLSQFLATKNAVDPEHKLVSLQSQRIGVSE